MKPPRGKGKRPGEKTPSGKRSAPQSVPPAEQTEKPGGRARPGIRPPQGGPTAIVGIGASAGGLEAFTQFLKHLPLNTGMGFVLVQHLDPTHESALTQILARTTALPVREIANNQLVEANHVYVIPRDTNLRIVNRLLKLDPREGGRMPHRPIDVYFESLAHDQGERAIGIVLSGTASDGTRGLEAIRGAGGITFAQDDSAKHDSMPRSAVAAGCVDLVMSPANIAKELARIAKHPFTAKPPYNLPPITRGDEDHAEAIAHQDDSTPLPSGGRGTPDTGGRQARVEAGHGKTVETDWLKKIMLLLRNHCGVDFSLYKSNTIQRRITRRLIISKQETMEDYAKFLRGNAQELDTLFSDVLISVTSFFRNPEMFETLQREVLPKLLAHRGNEPIRCWVLGCSTGQEAYSLAISFVEASRRAAHVRDLQVFATDLNDKLLEKARVGFYARSLAQDISPARLREFFVEEEGGYRINKSLRDMVVFARQNLIVDPPFSRLDLISCRNLLIYLEPNLQKKAIPTFHYALKPHGFLILGASESVGGFTDLFEPMDRKHKIFLKRAAATSGRKEQARLTGVAQPLLPLPLRGGRVGLPESLQGELTAQREADRIAINQFTPPGVLINDELQVLQFRGPTGAFLEPPAGKASFDVLKMAREGLMLPLRNAINKAKEENKTVRMEHVRVKRDRVTRTIHVEVIPLKNLRERCFLIMFEEAESESASALPLSRRQPAAPPPSTRPGAGRLAQLEAELSESREYLLAMREQNEVGNEELQASNEEVQSANEELQSMNEELETSKEELESANEELTTVNEEMSNRNVELNRLLNDMLNLQTSARLSIVLLGRDLTIRRFSSQAEKQFNLLTTDVGRPISLFRHAFTPADPTEPQLDIGALCANVISEIREQEREVRDRDGHWYSLRVRPYLTIDNKVDGAAMLLVDIDAVKRSEKVAADGREMAENTIHAVRDPLVVLDDQLRVESANGAFYHQFHVTPVNTIGKSLYALGNRQWDIPSLRELLEQVQSHRIIVENFLVEHDFEKTLGHRSMLLNARRIDDSQKKTKRILLAIEDITERKRAEEALARLASIIEWSEDAVVGIDLDGIVTSWNQGAQHLFGYTAQEIMGRLVSILIPPELENEEPSTLERVRSGESVLHYETVRLHKDGRRVNISLSVSPIKSAEGQVIGASKIARDITKRKRAEETLVQSSAQVRSLGEELARLNSAAVGRELSMIELKKEINGLCVRLDEPQRYSLEFEQLQKAGPKC